MRYLWLELIGTLIAVLMNMALLVGWIINAYQVGCGDITAIRVVGIIVFPLGSFLGLLG